jgi:uncharacterized membrane protein YcaP (DUF421 family)
VFIPTTPVWEILFRVTIVYFGLLILVRIAGKREVGQLGPIDLLAMLILSETVSPVLTAEDQSLGAGLIAAGTLLALGAGVGRLSYAFPWIEGLIDGKPVVLIRHGRIDRDAQQRERISRAELNQALRRQGVSDPSEVEEAVVETNGEISVVKRKG